MTSAVFILLCGESGTRAACLTASTAWQNAALTPQSAAFSASFDATPSGAKIDGVTGLSKGGATNFTSLAAIVRFNNTGFIDARNAGAYAADASLPYTAGATYHFRLVVDPVARRYSVFVTPPGAGERALATNYAFRAEQASASILDNWALLSTSGSHQVCGFALTGASPDSTPPVVSITTPAAGASVSGSAAVTASAFDNVGVLGVQFLLDGANLGPEDTQAPYAATWNTASASLGNHTLAATARDAAGNKTTSPPLTVRVTGASGCLTSSTFWQNSPLPAQIAAFNADFDATPNAAKIDGVIGLSQGGAVGFSSLAAIVRFNNTGFIDARNGAAYSSEIPVPYTGGATYHFRLAVDPVARRYSVFVTPPGAAEKALAANYAFRGEQSAITNINNWSLFSEVGSHKTCGLALSAPGPDSTAPFVAMTAPASGASVSGSTAVSASASDGVGVVGVQFQLDGANLGAEASQSPYAATWNTTSAAAGAHALSAVARDAAGNKGTASIPVTVNNYAPPPDAAPPTATIISPGAGTTVSGTVSASATAVDNVGVAGVQFLLDGTNMGPEIASPPYTMAWNTASSANGMHTLTASAKDAAGNRGSVSITVTVNNAAPPGGADRFGIKQMYPTAAGGKNWLSTWDNGVARDFSGVDPQDPWFDANHGNASFSVDGKGLFAISGSVPRMYIHDPALQQSWRNVEMTVYAYRVADGNTPWGGIEGVARSNHGITGSETANLCDSRGNDARFRYDGHIDFEKETSHPNSSTANNRAMWSTLPFRTWIGFKLVVYDLPNGNVKLENYMDLTDGAGGGTWTKVNELEDNGSNFGVGGTPCNSGINPALRLTNSDARPGTESGKPNITVYWRSDDVAANGLVYKKMSVREISAP